MKGGDGMMGMEMEMLRYMLPHHTNHPTQSTQTYIPTIDTYVRGLTRDKGEKRENGETPTSDIGEYPPAT
jgi:hypothetical protein